MKLRCLSQKQKMRWPLTLMMGTILKLQYAVYIILYCWLWVTVCTANYGLPSLLHQSSHNYMVSLIKQWIQCWSSTCKRKWVYFEPVINTKWSPQHQHVRLVIAGNWRSFFPTCLKKVRFFAIFCHSQTSPPHVSLSEMSVWFGEVDFTSEKPPVHRTTVQLSNHTYGKITVHWIDGKCLIANFRSFCVVPFW